MKEERRQKREDEGGGGDILIHTFGDFRLCRLKLTLASEKPGSTDWLLYQLSYESMDGITEFQMTPAMWAVLKIHRLYPQQKDKPLLSNQKRVGVFNWFGFLV